MDSYIRKWIVSYVHSYPERKRTATVWQEPIISFSAADDSLFGQLKEIVSPTHAIPIDFLPDAKSVITYFLPFDQKVVTSNVEGNNASLEWATAYLETNQLILDINTYVKDKLQEHHYSATLLPGTHNFNAERLVSDWSHRHIAYIAGLGTFGLNNMLITEKGCCGRIGSIVTNLKLFPTPRADKENCLYKYNGGCKKCVKLCVTGALTENAFDRFVCHEMTLSNADLFKKLGLADVCGKCLVNIPCSFRNPTSKLS